MESHRRVHPTVTWYLAVYEDLELPFGENCELLPGRGFHSSGLPEAAIA
jgi:hypothetical protein